MTSLAGLHVLVVDDDPDARDLLAMFLEAEGANVRLAENAERARSRLREAPVDVILTDASLPGEDGFAFAASLKDDPAARDIPVIAITGYADARSRQRSLAAGIRKYITKPFDVFALPSAIASVVAEKHEARVETEEERAARLIAGRDMRALLAELNAKTPYRFTSILRFDVERLESVWTFDRNDQRADTFPPEATVNASYCALVRTAGAPFAVSDALADPRVERHPKRATLRSYCGVPIFREDGSLFGTLCHYDEQPQPEDAANVGAMQRIAVLLKPLLPSAEQSSLGHRLPDRSHWI